MLPLCPIRRPDLPRVRNTGHSRTVTPLSAPDVQALLQELPGWAGDTQALHRSIEFPDFPTAIKAVGLVAEAAESMDHHPDMDIRWRTVAFNLSTHSAGGVTDLDIQLARTISAISSTMTA